MSKRKKVVGRSGLRFRVAAFPVLDLQLNGLRSLAVTIRLGLEGDALIAFQSGQARALDSRDMHEDIGLAIVRHDEAEALVGLEELNRSRLARAALDRRARTPGATAEPAFALAAAETVAATLATAEAVAATIAAAETVATTVTAAEAISAALAAAEAVAATIATAETVAATITAAEAIAATVTAAEAVAATVSTAEAVAATIAAAETVATTVTTATETVATAETGVGNETGLIARSTGPAGLAKTLALAATLGLVALAVVGAAKLFLVAAKSLRTTAPSALPTVVRTPVIHVQFTRF